MNEKVKVKFMRYKNVVLMEVLEMPDKYRGKGYLTTSVDSKYVIRSIHAPQIRERVLYLRGDFKEWDNNVSTCVYNTTYDALESIKCFSDLIRELNKQNAETTEATNDGEFEITIAE